MNTRLYPAPPTEEDLEVWCLVAYRFSFGDHVRWSALANVTRKVAKRDADLMLYAQQIASCGPCGIELYGIAFRGWDQAENGKLRGAL